MKSYSTLYAGSALSTIGGIGGYLTIEGSLVGRVVGLLLCSLFLCLISCLAVRKT